jgi:hypothetical protein
MGTRDIEMLSLATLKKPIGTLSNNKINDGDDELVNVSRRLAQLGLFKSMTCFLY